MQLDGASWVCPSFDPGSSITPLDNFGIRTSSATLSNHDFMNLFNEFLEPERCRPLIHPQGQVTYSGNPNEEVPSPELVVSSALTYQSSSDSTVTASVNRSYSLPRAPRPFVCTECSARFVEQRQLRNHERHEHQPHICTVVGCHAKYRHPKSLWQHQREKHDKIRLGCDQCDYTSGRKSNLKRHKEKKHG